jgi:hypothetical protein
MSMAIPRSEDDVQTLMQGIDEGRSLNSIAKEIGRSPRAVRFKLEKVMRTNTPKCDKIERDCDSASDTYSEAESDITVLKNFTINLIAGFGAIGLTTLAGIVYLRILISSLKTM